MKDRKYLGISKKDIEIEREREGERESERGRREREKDAERGRFERERETDRHLNECRSSSHNSEHNETAGRKYRLNGEKKLYCFDNYILIFCFRLLQNYLSYCNCC